MNGVVNFPFGTTYGEALIYTCNPGYLLVGNDTRVCEVTGDWSGVPPFCVIKGIEVLLQYISTVIILSILRTTFFVMLSGFSCFSF